MNKWNDVIITMNIMTLFIEGLDHMGHVYTCKRNLIIQGKTVY